MITQAIRREDWAFYFNLLSKITLGRQFMLEMIGMDVGDQIEVDWSTFEGVYFDSNNNTLYVQSPFFAHSIFGPSSVMFEEDGLLRAIAIKDAENHLQIIHFRDPLLLEGR